MKKLFVIVVTLFLITVSALSAETTFKTTQANGYAYLSIPDIKAMEQVYNEDLSPMFEILNSYIDDTFGEEADDVRKVFNDWLETIQEWQNAMKEYVEYFNQYGSVVKMNGMDHLAVKVTAKYHLIKSKVMKTQKKAKDVDSVKKNVAKALTEMLFNATGLNELENLK